MNRTLTEWRRSLGVGCIALWAVVGFSYCHAEPADAPAEQNQQVDPARKKLMAANGLFTRGLFKLAADEYGEFLEQYPNHAEATAARYALAVSRYKLREYDKAVEQLKQVLADSKFEQRDEALAVLGHCELSQNHYDAALAAFDELLGKFPTSKHAELGALSKGQVLYLAKQYPQAENACAAYLTKYPKGASRPDALYFLALSQRARNENEAAIKSLDELTRQFPDSPHQVDAMLLTGQSYEAEGKLDRAIEAYRAMLAAAPETRKADARYSLGLALYKSGKYGPAANELATIVSDFSTSSFAKPAKLQLGLAELAGGKTGEARNTLEAVARQDPERAAEAQYGLAQCDIADKRWDQAGQTLAALLAAQPAPANAAQIALDHAVCTMELKQFQPAADELEQFRAQYGNAPQLPEALYRQAFCLHKLQKYEQSHELCQQAAKLKAGDFAAANAELDAEDLFLLARYPQAEKQFALLAESAGDDDSRRLRFTFRRGQCEYFAGNYAKAVALLQPLASDAKVLADEQLQQAALLLGDALLQQNKYAQAIAPLKQYLSSAKAEREQAAYKLAVAQLRSNDPAAQETLATATQGPGESPWVQRAWFELGQLDLKDKKYDQAADAFRRVPSSAPAEVAAPAAYQLGWAEFEGKHFSEAAAAWKQMSAQYPKDKLAPDASFQQGIALREAKQLTEAAEVLQAYAAAHPDGQYALKARQLAAACYKDLGKNDQAEKMLADLAANATGTGSDGVLYDLAWAQRDAKDNAAAEATYQRLLKQTPQSKLAPAARTELAELLYNDKKYEPAAQLLEQVVQDKGVDPKVLSTAQYRLGWCYEKMAKPQKAAAVFAAYTEKGGGTDAMNASALLQSGIDYAADGKFDKAEQSLADMLKKYPDQKDAPVAMLKLGEVQAELQSYAASQATDEQFLQKYPTSELAYRAQFGIGWALENQKKYAEARKAYQKVIAATNGQTAARAQFQIGETWLSEGKFEQAVPALLAVEDVYAYPKWSARALFEAGRAFEQLKQNDQARKQYNQIVTKYKDAPEAGMAQDRLKTMAGL